MDQYPAIVSRKTTRLSQWAAVVEKQVRFTAEGEPQLYHFITQDDYVHVFGVTADGLIPIVRQYRPCLEVFTWEFPAGTVDPGESPQESGARELLEEAGAHALEMIDIGSYYPDTGRVQLMSHCFFARCAAAPKDFVPDEPALTVRYVTLDELKRMMLAGEFRHQLHVAVYAAAVLRGLVPVP